MDYPPCPYPPCMPPDGTPFGVHYPQKSLAVPHALTAPGHNPSTELDWHRPSSNILINSPCQLHTRYIDTENSLRSETPSPQLGIVSPSRVASPGSPQRQEIALVASGSTTAASENLTTVTGTKRTYDETLHSQTPIAATHSSSAPQLSKNLIVKPPAHRKTYCMGSSHRNLSKPFRSPLISSTSRINKHTPSPQPTPSSTEYEEAEASPSRSSNPTQGLFKPHLRSPLITVKSAGAASRPFRSPLTTSHCSDSKPTLSSIDRRKIQSLEKKLTTLRQARKYQLDGSTNHLRGLAQKWKAAAREAAQELWTVAQHGFSNGGTEDGGTATATSHDDDSWKSWGYGNGKEDDVLSVLKGGSKSGAHRDNWGWDDADVTLVEGHEDFLSGSWEPPSPATLGSQLAKPSGRARDKAKNLLDESDYLSHSRPPPDTQVVGSGRPDVDSEEGGESDARAGESNIGTMLVQLGIAKETLGWNDAEEEFVD